MQKILSLFCSLLLLLLIGCNNIGYIPSQIDVPTSVTIEGVEYRNGFYGDLYPMFGEVENIRSDTLQKGIVYDDGTHEFRRVDFEGHDWVHSYIGPYAGGTVYCAENQWEQMNDYYADPDNFQYYIGIGYYITEEAVSIDEIDQKKFNELLAFGKENEYSPFDKSSNEKAVQKVRRLPKDEFREGICFYKVSCDGYFSTIKSPMYFVNEDKLLLVFYHDGGRDNGGVEEVVAIDVPDELGQYFIDLIEKYHP